MNYAPGVFIKISDTKPREIPKLDWDTTAVENDGVLELTLQMRITTKDGYKLKKSDADGDPDDVTKWSYIPFKDEEQKLLPKDGITVSFEQVIPPSKDFAEEKSKYTNPEATVNPTSQMIVIVTFGNGKVGGAG